MYFEGSDRGGKMPDLIGFRQTEIHIAAQHVVQSQKFCRDLVRYLDQIFRRSAAERPPPSAGC